MDKIVVSSPGRICLFGEDVDYMGLEVITLAINQRIKIQGFINNSGIIRISLQDLNKKLEFKNEKQELKTRRDYVASAFNLYHKFLPQDFGADIQVNSSLLIGKGLSSSSAFSSVLVAFFDKAAKINSSKKDIALNAFRAEVINLGEPGGMMDHFASVLGGTVYLECREPYNYQQLKINLSGLVVGDTLKEKATIETIAKRKKEILKGIEIAKKEDSDFNLSSTKLNKILKLYEEKRNIGLKRLLAIIGIRDVVRRGYKILTNTEEKVDKIAELFNQHHHYQEKYLENVTDKMKLLIKKARNAGARGCKLLGSGNGGSFLAYAPKCENEVIKAIEEGGGKAYCVNSDVGLTYH